MRLYKALLLLLVIGTWAGCSGGGGGGGGGSNGSPPTPTCIAGVSTANTSNTSPTPASGDNVVTVTVNGDLCSPSFNAYYPNKPCVQVTVCKPGSTSNCQTISDILLDTGSYGIRIFKYASAGNALLTVPLTQVQDSSGNKIAECAQFASGATWGPVQIADVYLGTQVAGGIPTQASGIPIQVIDPTFYSSAQSSVCANADQYPSDAMVNGILGIGPLIYDCGSYCTTRLTSPGTYYACSGNNCAGTTVPLANQVQNPVPLLPSGYNNGVIIQLPAAGAGGSPSIEGALVLGIGTLPVGVTQYPVDNGGNIITVFNNTQYVDSFFDTGSNGLFFPPIPSLPACQGQQSQDNYWFCPSSPVCLSAVTEGATGTPTSQDTFQIGNFLNLLMSNPSNRVFPTIGGNYPDAFDWGLPFFLGRSVYIGMSGANTPLGAGPYFAY